MTRALQIAHLVLIVCFCTLGIYLTILIRHSIPVIDQTGQAVQGIATLTTRLQGDEQAARLALASDHTKLLKTASDYDTDLKGIIWAIDDTIVTVDGAATAQTKYWNDNSQKFGAVLDSSKKALDALPPVLNGVGQTVAKLNTIADYVNAILADDHIRKMVEHWDGTSANMQRITAAAATKAEELAAPPTKKKAIVEWVGIAARIFYYLKP